MGLCPHLFEPATVAECWTRVGGFLEAQGYAPMDFVTAVACVVCGHVNMQTRPVAQVNWLVADLSFDGPMSVTTAYPCHVRLL